MTAAQTMTNALTEMADTMQRPPCTRDGRWLSDDRTERRWAARHCRPCPLLDLCQDLALELRPRVGVWGGVDLAPKRRPRQDTP